MPTLTIRGVDEAVYEGLKVLAAARQRSMEAECRRLLDEGLRRHRRWEGATLADLSGDPALARLDPAFVRSDDAPREVEW